MPAASKILLVDDNPLVLGVMSKALTQGGFQCTKANSAAEALEWLKKDIPDIILSDYEMPGMNGFEFRQRLMETPIYRQIPFMFLTSKHNTELMIEGMNMDAIDYIIKDVPVPVIISKISNVLATIREQHERSISELSRAASALQLNSVPHKAPVIAGFDIQFWHKPYQGYPGGDFIDFIKVDARYTIVVLGDVMGKKWGAWFFSFGFLSYIRAAVRLTIFEGDNSTQSILQKINTVLYQDPVMSEVLSAVSLVMLDTHSGQLKYSGAGDLPLLYYSKEKNQTERLQSAGLLLGLRLNGEYDEFALNMQPGDQLFMITDGMTDSEVNGRKKSDYADFEQAVLPYLGTTDTFDRLTASDFLTRKATEQVDDCSFIFLQKQASV